MRLLSLTGWPVRDHRFSEILAFGEHGTSLRSSAWASDPAVMLNSTRHGLHSPNALSEGTHELRTSIKSIHREHLQQNLLELVLASTAQKRKDMRV